MSVLVTIVTRNIFSYKIKMKQRAFRFCHAKLGKIGKDKERCKKNIIGLHEETINKEKNVRNKKIKKNETRI